MADRSFYNSWIHMIDRCNNPYSSDYKRYGAREIKIDPSWLSFEQFTLDMKITHKKGLSLERIDNNGNYCKENCRWATKREQANNRRTSKWITYKGATKTLAQWIELLKLKSSTVRQRLYVYKWNINDCFEGRVV